MIHPRALLILLCICLPCSLLNAEIVTKEETVDGKKQLVLESDLVRMVVLPDPGGTVVDFIHKPTNTNFVAGGDNVRKGKLGFGWKDYYWLEGLEHMGKGVFTLPYTAEFRTGPDYKAIYVKCEIEGQRFEREMRLTEKSAELTTLSKVTNIGKEARRLQVRWHTYSELDDQLAVNSCIVVPGPGGEIRKCFIGSGWDHQMIASDGFWIAANYKSGLGMWMTFKKEQNSLQITWTDSNYARNTPARGMYVAEPHPQPVLAQPGESAAYESTFCPFTAADAPTSIPLGMLREAGEQERARQFLSNVLPNLAAIGPFSMAPGDPPAGQTGKPNENRFDFSHRRRDRFALRPWGILDALMAVPSLQDKTIRCRYYARLFDSVTKPTKVSFRLRMFDPSGKVAREQVKDFVLDPAAREVDVRDDVPMTGLPDGMYQFVLDGLVEGEKEPIHTYIENRRLVASAKPAYDKAMVEADTGPLVERPFVTALRTVAIPASQPGQVAVPIGVEEGGGVARAGWPVRCGVPFAQGMVAKDAALELVGPDGKAVALQASPMATWLDGSVKWLLVDFPADVPANGHVFYTLKSKADAATAGPALAAGEGKDARVTAAPFTADPAKLLGLFGPQDLWWADGAGQKYFFRVAGDESGIVIEENGGNRAVIKATGWYFNEQNRPVCMGELRLEHYRGQSFVRLYHTVTFGGDPWREELGSYGLRLQLPKAGFAAATVEVDGKGVAGKQIALLQKNAEGADLQVDGQATQGRRSIGAVSFTGGAGTPVSVFHRNFWQMAPKKIEADAAAGSVTFSYWPSEVKALSFLPREDGWIPSSSSAEAIAVGMGRTHEIIIDFGTKAAVTEFEKIYSEPIVVLVPPRYLTQTKAMMHLAPYDPQRQPTLERVISGSFDSFIAQRDLFGWYGEWFFGGVPNFWRESEYRWLDFGRYAWILNEQDGVETPWLCFMRSGDRKYLKFAESNTRHLLEVATIRWNPTWQQGVGLSRRHHECIWISTGDTGHSMLDPFLDYYYATGYRPAGDAAKRMAKAMSYVPTGAWRYLSNPIAGLARMYLDTQDPFYKEHADRLWNTACYPEQNDWWYMDHGHRMTMWYAQMNPQCKELWANWTLNPEKKDRFNAMDVLTARYLETGDAKYAAAAAKLIPTQRVSGLMQSAMVVLREACYAGGLPPEEKTAPTAAK